MHSRELGAWPPETIRAALVSQWRRLAAAIRCVDLRAVTRVAGWTNRELVAHLTVQPLLLGRFLNGANPDASDVTVEQNLLGTVKFAATIDQAARQAGAAGRLDFAGNVARTVPLLLSADLNRNVVTLQGPIALVDYLVTRCVEAVVHGLDLAPALDPDPDAAAIAADALLCVLAARAPYLLAHAGALDRIRWLDRATGRARDDDGLAAVLPLVG